MKSTFNSFNTYNSFLETEKNRKKNVSFRNLGPIAAVLANPALTKGLQLTQTNEMVDKVGVDLGSMVLPRTAIDASINPYAGMETFSREIAATFTNCFAPGLAALGIGWAFEKMFEKSLGVKGSMMMNDSTMDFMHHVWTDKENPNFKESVFAERGNFIKRLSQEKKKSQSEVEKLLKGQTISNLKTKQVSRATQFEAESFFKKLVNLDSLKVNLAEAKELTQDQIKEAEKSLNKASSCFGRLFGRETPLTRKGLNARLQVIERKIGRALNNRDSLKVTIGKKELETSAKALVENAHSITKNVFLNKNLKVSKQVAIDTLKMLNKVKIFGLVGVATFGFFTQKINRWLTERRTGKKGFVGYSDFGKDNNAGSKKPENNDKADNKKKGNTKLIMQKAASMAAIAGYCLATMAIFSKDKSLSVSSLAKRLQFNSWVPNMDHLKIAYAAVIAGRQFAADDSCELKQSNFRDFLGFTNWLVLGGVVAKATATVLSKPDEKLISYMKSCPKDANIVQKAWHWLNNANMRTHNEIFDEAANVADKRLRELAKKGNKITAELTKNVKNGAFKDKAEQMVNLNKSIIAGLAWSCVTLGIVVPYLNKKMGQKEREKQLAASEANKAKPVEVPKTVSANNSTYQVNNIIVQEFLKNIKTKNP